jgi:prepilin-type N-terminal cleavage/methylation domain-containing protein
MNCSGHGCRAFTLLEILIVVAVIALVAALIFSAQGPILQWIDGSRTGDRMRVAQESITRYAQGLGQDRVGTLFATTGVPARLGTLRQVMETLTQQHGLDLRAKNYTANRQTYMPPLLGNRWAHQPNDALWSPVGTTLSNTITHYKRIYALRSLSHATVSKVRSDLVKVKALEPHLGLEYLNCWDSNDEKALYAFGSSTTATVGPEFFKAKIRGNLYWPVVEGTASQVGETLDSTLEIIPDAVRPSSWYEVAWPNLKEDAVGGQVVWPVATWRTDLTSAALPPRLAWPWGGKRLSRRSVSTLDAQASEQLTYADFTPQGSQALLQATDILPAAAADNVYRQDRKRSRAWNDAWGNPLVVVCAAFLPLRYSYPPIEATAPNVAYIEPSIQRAIDANGTPVTVQVTAVPTTALLGGRDWLMSRSRDAYGYARSFYYGIAAAGPVLRTALPDPWTAPQDRGVAQAIWLQVSEVCGASELTERNVARPPWKEIRERRGTTNPRERCFLSLPQEIRQ